MNSMDISNAPTPAGACMQLLTWGVLTSGSPQIVSECFWWALAQAAPTH